MRSRALAIWCVVAAAVCWNADGFTVDCDRDYADCESELRNLSNDERAEESAIITTTVPFMDETSTPFLPTIPTPKINKDNFNTTEHETNKPRARLLNINMGDINPLEHNDTEFTPKNKKVPDLSDVTLDEDDEDEMRFMGKDDFKIPKTSEIFPIASHDISNNFFTHLKAPFRPPNIGDKASTELQMCKENGIPYKVGEKLERGCEEICECLISGDFECFPRCKHPYIRHGRTFNDPLCFESPVDECCSIMACSTGTHGDLKPVATNIGLPNIEEPKVCHHGTNTYKVGEKWNIGCEEVCECTQNVMMNCKPRCPVLPPVSEKCINVQNPKDECCEMQVCDVSQDDHEESVDNITSINTITEKTVTEEVPNNKSEIKTTSRPLVLAEPIGSVKVLQNNSVQINLIHMNTTADPIHLLLSSDGGKTFNQVELKYGNLLLNLDGGKDYVIKTKESGTNFNFTIMATDNGDNEVKVDDSSHVVSKAGCEHDGQFYNVGDEFHIGCSELCECIGPNKKECVALECPAHVGIEILFKGCIRWAPVPPPQPPNCCPRAARCLNDGSCQFMGKSIPNWSEVPTELSGCERRCFCDDGELDCQEICSPLPALPPSNLRCHPGQRPAPVDISENGCCKEWGCVGNARSGYKQSPATESMLSSVALNINYVTPIMTMAPTVTSVLLTPPTTTDVNSDFLRYLTPTKTLNSNKIAKTVTNIPSNNLRFNLDLPSYDYYRKFDDSVEPSYFSNHFTNPFSNSNDLINHSVNSKDQQFPDSNKITWLTNIRGNDYDSDYNINSNENITRQNVPHKSHYKDNKVYKVGSISKNEVKPNSPFLPNSLNMQPNKEANYFLTDEFGKEYDHIQSPQKYNLFKPLNITTYNLPHAKPIVTSNYQADKKYLEPNLLNSLSKNIKVLNAKDLAKAQNNDIDILTSDSKRTHVLTKDPNPYETMLLSPTMNTKLKNVNNIKANSYALDLEHILSQIEIETELNRNFERSAQNARVKRPKAGVTPDKLVPPSFKPTQPPFLPTIPAEVYNPHEEIFDFNQNNIHRPPNSREPELPHNLPTPPNYGDKNKLTVLSYQADSPSSVKIIFGLPPVLVGLRGSVNLTYIATQGEDSSRWQYQIFAPVDEILATPTLEFRLTGLKPSTPYNIKGKLYVHNLSYKIESEAFIVRTMDLPSIEEKTREIDSQLTLMDVNDTTADIVWRHFTEEELHLIDGIQIRYRPVGTPIYSMTELLHHSRTTAKLHDLRPGSKYEASLVLIPPPRGATELQDPKLLQFETAPYIDPYNWTVSVELRAVGSEAAEVIWRGVPSPAERWVRVYRAAHACGAGRTKEHDAFRLASRDQPNTITLTGLEPNSRCRVWLELFLTNGKVKTSNVVELTTKSLDSAETVDNIIEASSVTGGRENGPAKGNYYGALVAVGVVAALGAVTSLLLLLVVVKRHRPHSVPITSVPSAPRDSSLPPYDNPAYKLELQQETMDL